MPEFQYKYTKLTNIKKMINVTYQNKLHNLLNKKSNSISKWDILNSSYSKLYVTFKKLLDWYKKKLSKKF